MITLLTRTTLLLFGLSSYCLGDQNNQLNVCPNIHLIGSKDATLYIHPKNTESWFMEHKPTEARIGQINACKINNSLFAVSVPHVVNTPGWAHSAPKEKSIGAWKDSVDGREISFAKLIDSSLGFPKELPEAAVPKDGSTISIFGTLFDPISQSIVMINIPGTLEILDQKDTLEQLATFFQEVNPKGAITKRLNVTAKNRPILSMVADPKFTNSLQGLSGAFVWQNKKPIGVFIAAALYEGQPPILLAEPLLESAQKTIPSLK